MIGSLYRTLGITLHSVRADYDCVWWLFFFSAKYQIEQLVLPCFIYSNQAEPLYIFRMMTRQGNPSSIVFA